MAAERAGIRTVLIPKDNVRDMEDVPEEIREKLVITPVETVSEVIREALHIRLPERDTRPFQNEAESGGKRSGKGREAAPPMT